MYEHQFVLRHQRNDASVCRVWVLFFLAEDVVWVGGKMWPDLVRT